MGAYKQPWIGKPWTDISFILLPPFLSLLVIMIFPSLFRDDSGMPDAGWVILILLIDVAHVYSTLYRTYFDPHALKHQRSLLWLIPFIGLVAGVLLYSFSSIAFWRVLAYVAVYHFVRQQYGFMRVYSRKEPKTGYKAVIDKFAIYYAALYPLLYWHLKGPRNFNWFLPGDFLFFSAGWLLPVATVVYIMIVAVWVAKELRSFFLHRFINVPKVAIISGTMLSWYFGIVYFNGDLAFTLLNVVSHGVPYMALVWLHGRKQYVHAQHGNRFLRRVFGRFGLLLFLCIVFLLAFLEEGLWDIAVWQEHGSVFGTATMPKFHLSNQALSIIVPMLALPQVTHYILDGFIWKVKQDEFRWSNER